MRRPATAPEEPRVEKTFINPPDVYKAPWRFNQAIKVKDAGSLVFLSGIVGYDLDGSLPKDILTQAENTYASLKRIVEAAGGTLADVVKTNVYVGEEYQIHKDELRDIRAKYFTDDYPATTLLRVAGFAQTGYLIEIEAIAVLPD
jgi:enamine deaminase RidA (YjgF/YER057c/UK114 family)